MSQSNQPLAAAPSENEALGSRENWWGEHPDSDRDAETTDNTQPTGTDPRAQSKGEKGRSRATDELLTLTERWLDRYDLDDNEIEAVVDHARRLKKNGHENNLSDVEILGLAVEAAGVTE